MEKGKWIFLVSKLPTEVSPPAMSLHYAIPWPMENAVKEDSAEKQAKKLRNLLSRCAYIDPEELKKTSDNDLWDFIEDDDEVRQFIEDNDEFLVHRAIGYEYSRQRLENRRLRGALQIKFAGENIRIFPEEFSEISLEKMKEYMDFYIFHPTDLWNGLGMKPTDPDEKFIFEAALLDGCTEYQANNIVNGGDIDSVDDFPAPLGWYECPKEFGLVFKTEEELTPRYKEEIA